MNAPAADWAESPRSVTLTRGGIVADVWPIVDRAGRTIWNWTTRRDDTGVYTNRGGELSEAAARAAAEGFLNLEAVSR